MIEFIVRACKVDEYLVNRESQARCPRNNVEEVGKAVMGSDRIIEREKVLYMRYFVDDGASAEETVWRRAFNCSLVSEASRGRRVRKCENRRLKKPSISEYRIVCVSVLNCRARSKYTSLGSFTEGFDLAEHGNEDLFPPLHIIF